MSSPTSDAPVPEREGDRTGAWRTVAVVSATGRELVDGVARLAASICATPVAGVSLIDGSNHRVVASTQLRGADLAAVLSWCRHVLLGTGVLVVPDATADERFARNPAVGGPRGLRFYAGVPLVSRVGAGVGAVWVSDHVAGALTTAQADALADLARQAAGALELGGRLAETEAALGRAQVSLRQKDAIIEFLEAQRAWTAASPSRPPSSSRRRQPTAPRHGPAAGADHQAVDWDEAARRLLGSPPPRT